MLKVPALKLIGALPEPLIPAAILYVALLPPLNVSPFELPLLIVPLKLYVAPAELLLMVTVRPPPIEIEPNLKGPVPLHVTVCADDAYESVQPDGRVAVL